MRRRLSLVFWYSISATACGLVTFGLIIMAIMDYPVDYEATVVEGVCASGMALVTISLAVYAAQLSERSRWSRMSDSERLVEQIRGIDPRL